MAVLILIRTTKVYLNTSFYDFFLLFRHKKNSKANLINIFSYNNNISTYLSQTFHFISNSINSVTHSCNILLPRHHFKVIDQIDMSIHLVLSTDVCLSMCDVFMCYFRIYCIMYTLNQDPITQCLKWARDFKNHVCVNCKCLYDALLDEGLLFLQ